MNFRDKNYWALILGGSSGFGMATAKKLSSCGMNICVVHRDRKGAMARIEKDFDEIRSTGVQFKSFNLDALSAEPRALVIEDLSNSLGAGKIRLLMHSIAFGSLKLVAPLSSKKTDSAALLAKRLGLDTPALQREIDGLFAEGDPNFVGLATSPQYESELLLDEEDLLNTISAMGTSMLTWTRACFDKKLFAPDARVIGLTSEGNEVAWYGYAAVSAAKVALESVSRSIAREYAAYGIRSNIVQPGVTDTPALRMIPGNAQLMAHGKLKNPFGRLTQVEDVANMIALLSSDEAAWVNGALIRVDGGEAIAG